LVIFAISHYTSFKSVFAASADEKVTPAPDETSGNA
jgi:hypothetical protein